MCGISIDDTEHPALHQLLNQRRSYTDIVKLINQPFYRNRLVSKVKDVHKCTTVGPLAGRSISQIKVTNGAVRFTKGGTRQNHQNAVYVISLLDRYNAVGDNSFTIGVITPYKGQASLLRALVHERNYPTAFVQNIKIGTVHTFQGSEGDVIIFDVVDTTIKEDGGSVSVGKIYSGQEGEQLVNVAVSRARHKLIVVGDTQHFQFATGNSLEAKTLNILNKLGNYSVN
jgi:superfamily I DNA and/or RNA helicase